MATHLACPMEAPTVRQLGSSDGRTEGSSSNDGKKLGSSDGKTL